MTKQWLQISAIWLGVAVLAGYAVFQFDDATAFGTFSALAGGSIALVSLEHLISARAKDTVRQQIYAASGSVAILGAATLAVLVL